MISLLLALLVFVVPSNLFLKIAPETAYVRGLQIDYLIPKIALSELVVFALLIALIWTSRAYLLKDFTQTFHQMVKSGVKNKMAFILPGLIGLLLLRQFSSRYPLTSIDAAIDIGALTMLAFFSHYRHTNHHFMAFFSSQGFLWALIGTLIFQSSLAIYQFFAQKSLFGYLFLGEGNIQAISSVSRISWFGEQLVAPMGTTAHSNVLGGVLAIYLVILAWKGGRIIKSEKRHQELLRVVTICACILGLLALFLTASITAWLTLIMGFFAWKIEKKHTFTDQQGKYVALVLIVAALMMPLAVHTLGQLFPDNNSFSRREYLNEAAWRMWLDHPWLGVGLQNATGHIEEYSQVREVARFTQPPHAIWLLWLTETGVMGYLVIGTAVFRIRDSNIRDRLLKLFFITFFIQSLDHYLLTLSSGRELLLILFLVL